MQDSIRAALWERKKTKGRRKEWSEDRGTFSASLNTTQTHSTRSDTSRYYITENLYYAQKHTLTSTFLSHTRIRLRGGRSHSLEIRCSRHSQNPLWSLNLRSMFSCVGFPGVWQQCCRYDTDPLKGLLSFIHRTGFLCL